MNTKIVTVTAPGGTGSVGYTGVGFQPKALIVMGANTTLGDGAFAFHGFGAGVAGSTAHCQGVSANAAATSSVDSNRSSLLISYRNNAGTQRTAASLTSLDADGFTLNWTSVTDARTYFILCIGGSDVEAAVGSFTAGGATGNRSVTGLSFQPNAIIFFDSRLSTTASGSEAFWGPMLGLVDSAGNQGAYCGESWDGQATMVTSRNQKSTTACIVGTADSGGNLDKEASFVSYNADGFTVNFTTLTALGQNTQTFYIALQVPYSQVGSFNTRTTTGTTSTATPGFTPKALILGGNRKASGSDPAQDHFFSTGLAASASEQGYMCHHDEDGIATSNTYHAQNNDAILRWLTNAPSTVVEAAVTDMSFENFTLDYSTVEATARPIIYLAMGDATAVVRQPFAPAINFQDPAHI